MTQKVNYLDVDALPHPAGHYSHAVRCGNLLFISGQLPGIVDPVANEEQFAAEARAAITKVLTILRKAGGAPSDLVKVNAFIVGIENWPLFDRIYAELLGKARPARAVIPVPCLHYGFMVEVDAVATVR